MKPTLRTLGWAVAVIWATGMTLAVARISGTLDAIAARPSPPAVVSPARATDPSELAISLRAAPGAAPVPAATARPVDEPVVADASPEQQAAHREAEAVLAEIVKNGRLDDDSTASLRAAISAMRPQDRIQILSAFAAAATRGEIAAAPEDYRRILP